MCFVFESDIDDMLLAITQYVKANHITNPSLSDNLKDYLAELKDLKLINYCGCDGLYQLKLIDNYVIVYIEIVGNIIKFVINDEPYHEKSSHSEALDNYDDIEENDYLDF